MSVMTQHLVKILQCDRRTFSITLSRLAQLEEVIHDVPGLYVSTNYDDIREKYQYILQYYDKDEYKRQIVFESKNKIDAFVRLVLRVPAFHEPVRVRYNQLVHEKYINRKELRAQQRKEERYQKKLELIEKLKDCSHKYY